jgi:long-subunit fatty acid transport protein
MRTTSGLCAAFLLAATALAAAQDQQLGARTKAMGGSYTAFEDDPVSVWLNPAGIATQPDQMSLAYQTYTAYPKGQERGPGDSINFTVGPEPVMGDPVLLPSYLGFVFQLGNPDAPLAVGLCYARPYLLNYAMDQVTDPNQSTFQPEAEIEQSFYRFRAAIAKDFLFRARGEPGAFNHLSIGLGLDIGFEKWEFSGLGQDVTDTSSGFGFGFGLLLGLYDNTESFKVNLGAAYSSKVNYDFEIEPDVLPAFDMPQQFTVGMTFYMLQGLPLRVTVDAQLILWEETSEDPIFAGFEKFEDAVNFSIGFEYRIPVSDTASIYPRFGLRRFDAPWSDEVDLPMTGAFRLVLDTDDEVFTIFTYGIGVSWTTEAGKLRALDLAGDAGGDAFNLAMGFTFEF